MSALKKLAGQTAIYGLSSIVGRFLNYLLTPLYTAQGVFPPEEYGLITTFYAWAAIVAVMLLYGMETTFFRFANKKENDAKKSLATAYLSVAASTLLFAVVFFIAQNPIAKGMGFGNASEYVLWFAAIMGLEALTALPMARLRHEGKAKRFAAISLINVFVNIGLNLFFIAYCMRKFNAGETNAVVDALYSPAIGVGYVFIINVISTAIKALLLLPTIPRNAFKEFDFQLLKKMLRFTWPLLVIGLAGMINEAGDRILLKKILEPIHGQEYSDAQVGIYGACYKLAILISLFVQAFRYAAEPFFFAKAEEGGSRETFARVMHVFTAFIVGVFLLVALYLDVFKAFIRNPAFHVGLSVVPILLLANALLGIYYNLSIWYKLSDRTLQGGYISLIGAAITIGINVLFIPTYGYMASAWATLICFSVMVVISYLLGQKHYPIPYNVPRILVWFFLGIVLWKAAILFKNSAMLYEVYRVIALLGYCALAYQVEFKNSRLRVG